MQFYGNKTWNNATDNRDKSIIPMRENQFAEMLIFLEHSGLNFYAYVKDGSAVLAVNSSDIDKLKNVLGSQLDGLNIGKSAKPFSPPQKNIIVHLDPIPPPHHPRITPNRSIKASPPHRSQRGVYSSHATPFYQIFNFHPT